VLLAVRLKLSSSGYDPSGTGLDPSSVTVIPWSPVDDVTVITWTIADVFTRCETPGGSTSTVRIPYYSGTGDFSATGYVDASGVNLGAGVNESSRPASLALTTIPSGYKVASNWTALGSGVAGLAVYVVLNALT
jgi:hypothetical protein